MLKPRFFIYLACAVLATHSCLIADKKEDQEVHVFHIGPPNNAPGNEPDIIELHIPDSRKKRGLSKDDEHTSNLCKLDADCPPGLKCIWETSKCRKHNQ